MVFSKVDSQQWGTGGVLPSREEYLIEKLELLSSILESRIYNALVILRDEKLPAEARVIEATQILQES